MPPSRLFLSLLFAVSAFAQESQTFTCTGSPATFTVPAGVTTLTIAASGAQGGTGNTGVFGGKGAMLTAAFPVTPLETLHIVVGCAGASSGNVGAGGGGSFVYRQATATGLLLAAAGGGGTTGDGQGGAGSSTTTGGNGGNSGAAAGTGGNGGAVAMGGGGASGGGLLTDGGGAGGGGGKALANGANGGNNGGGTPIGGFGGGGGAEFGGGGGGGYNGGGGGADPGGGGGGGGSFSATPIISSAGGSQSGNGQVVITLPPPAIFSCTGALQTFPVPAGVSSITITAAGAQGGAGSTGAGGKGATLTAAFPVTPLETLNVLVGCIGGSNPATGGGGGGSFVYRTATAPGLLIAAAGGGGAWGANPAIAGSATTTASAGQNAVSSGGAAGTGGNGGAAAIPLGGGGGGGLLTDGGTFFPGNGGKGLANGGAGGTPGISAGGFGGGGASVNDGGGGGGGYNGGGGGGEEGAGGGGGSFSAVTPTSMTSGAQSGNGQVTITWMGQVTATAGNPQSNPAGASFSFPLEVTVTDPDGAYESGTSVTFTTNPGVTGASTALTTTTVSTDATGRARWTPAANATAGVYTITASAANHNSATFVVSNVNTTSNTGSCQAGSSADDLSATTLRSVIATCGKGATIFFPSSLYFLSQGVEIPLIQDVTLHGGGAYLDAGHLSRHFYVSGGTVQIEQLNLNNGLAAGGKGGDGSAGGGGGAGMGGALFLNNGTLVLGSVGFISNQALGGAGGSAQAGSTGVGGGGGVGGPGGSGVLNASVNGGGGGVFGTSGGSSGDGTGGGTFNGESLNGGFGGGGAGGTGASGNYSGQGGAPGNAGAGGDGLGGAIFARNGLLVLNNVSFFTNSATRGGGSGTAPVGKGGALMILPAVTAISIGALPAFSGDSAPDFGAPALSCGGTDTNDVCGNLQIATVTASGTPQTATINTAFAQQLVAGVAVGGTGIAGVPVTFAGPASGASINPPFVTAVTNSAGNAAAGVTANGTSGTYSVQASIGTFSTSATYTLTNALPATHFSVSASSNATAGTGFNFTVTALDQNNNTASVYTGTVHFTSTDGSAVLPGDYTFTSGDAGVHIFPVTLKTAGVQTITGTDTVTSSITGTSNSITVGASAATHFRVSAPGSTPAGTAFNFTITALDQFNNTATGYAGTAHFTSTDGQAVLPANSTLSNGAGTFSATLRTAGSQTVTATDTVTPGINGTSGTIAVIAAPSIGKSFGATSIPFSGTTTLSFTITNPAANPAGLTGIGFTDSLPAGLVVATPANSTSTCNGVFTATSGATSVSLAGGSIATPGATCALSLNVTGVTPGSQSNTVASITSANGGAGGPSNTAVLTVGQPPAITAQFVVPQILLGASTNLVLTIANANAFSLTGVGMSDVLPAGLIVSPNYTPTTTCGGTITSTSGSVTLTGGTLPSGGTCTVLAVVIGTQAGTFTDTATVTSNEGGANPTPATAGVVVIGQRSPGSRARQGGQE